jgi:hypothetical protein
MIVFNTRKKAEHYIKYKKARQDQYENWQQYNDEEFCYYIIDGKKVLRIWGWRCGCGCDRGDTNATVIGRIKSI